MKLFILLIRLITMNSPIAILDYTPFGIEVEDNSIQISCKGDEYEYYLVTFYESNGFTETREITRNEFVTKTKNYDFEIKEVITSFEKQRELKILSNMFDLPIGGFAYNKIKTIGDVRIAFISFDDGHAILHTFIMLRYNTHVFIAESKDEFFDIIETKQNLILIKRSNYEGSFSIFAIHLE